MRILLITPMPPQEDGAGAIPILLYAQLLGLRERNNEVTLVSSVGEERGEAEAAERLRASGLDAHFADRRVPDAAGRRWRRRARMAGAWALGRPWRAVWFADPGIQAILDRLAASHDFEIVAVEDSAMSGYRLPAGVASILTEHEVLQPRPVEWRPGLPTAWPGWAFGELDWRRRPPFQARAWRSADRVIAFGRRDAEAIATLASDVAGRVRISPFGLALPPAAAPGEQAGTVLFTGNFTHQPNRDAAAWLASEIMPALLAREPGARLSIVGSNPPAEVRALAGPGLEVHADVPEIESFIERAAVVVAPVRTGGGMRMKVLQALAAGKAVVTSGRGAEGFDCFDETPPLAVAGDATSFATAIAELLADPTRRAEQGRRARAFAERNCSPRAWAERLEPIYAEAAAARRPDIVPSR